MACPIDFGAVLKTDTQKKHTHIHGIKRKESTHKKKNIG